ncbi:MAG: hypothetical protein P9L99_05945 [Candidatus Lernaella stagnicola]|nr:hypothetical protein [Candidatus Lernaella stagnicola]
MKTTRTFLLIFLALLVGTMLLTMACGDDDDDDNDTPSADDDDDNDTTGDDDDTADDDTGADDDTTDDDDDTTDDDDNDDDTPPPEICDWENYNPLVVSGKQHLYDYEFDAAYGDFLEATRLCPEVGDAKLGMLAADVQWYVDMFQRLIQFITNFNPAPHEQGDKSIGTVVQAMVRDYMLPVNAEITALAADLRENHPQVEFYFEELPLWVDGDHVILDMGGEWDIADVENAYAFAQLVGSFEHALLAYDATFNYYTFAHWEFPASGDIKELLHSLSGLLIALLEDPDYPELLTFLDDGEEQLTSSCVNGGLGLRTMAGAFAMAMEETEPQEDDVLGYIDANGNGRYDEGELWHVPFFLDLSPELQTTIEGIMTMSNDLGAALLDGGPEDINPSLPNWFVISELNWLMELLDVAFAWFDLPEIRLLPVPVPIGPFLYNPPEDGMRSTVLTIAQYIYDATMPEEVLP